MNTLASARRIAPARTVAAAMCGAILAASLSLVEDVPPQRRPRMFDPVPTPVALIPPGTAIPDGPPDGWTHLLVKCRSRPHSGDVDHLNDTLKRLTTFLSSAMVLRIEPAAPGGPPCRIAEIAFGITAEIDGRDTVISSGTQAELGARLGFLERLGLARAEARLPGLIAAARSDTMVVVDAPTQMLRDGRHVDVVFRSAILLDERTGDVATLSWVVDLDGESYAGVGSDVAVVPPGFVREILLHVDAREFVLGMITERALATPGPPNGERQLPMPRSLSPIASRQTFTEEEFVRLQSGLRDLRRAPPAASPG